MKIDTNTLIQQLGGLNMICAMTGANSFVKSEDYLMFSFKGSRKMNKVQIRLTPTDEYEMAFYKISGMNFKEVSTVSANCDNIKQIFQSETGLCLSL